jgi:hypothetical protein
VEFFLGGNNFYSKSKSTIIGVPDFDMGATI